MKMPLCVGLAVLCAMAHGGAWAADAEAVAVSDTLAPMGDATGGNGVVAAAPTEAQADAAFAAARKSFMAVAEGAAPETRLGDVVQKVGPDTPIAGGTVGDKIALEDIKLVLDVEDASLREVVTRIVSQAARYTGPWTVKWRLRPENLDLMDERVNLTVEAPFGEFCDLLTERVKNMTGTQLYVTAFKGSRSILVTDTYY